MIRRIMENILRSEKIVLSPVVPSRVLPAPPLDKHVVRAVSGGIGIH